MKMIIMKINKQFLNAAGRAVLGLALETVEPLTLSMIIKKNVKVRKMFIICNLKCQRF